MSINHAITTTDNVLHQCLGDTPYKRFLGFAPSGLQLPSFFATVHGLKPAMDLWIEPEGWNSFSELASYFGLYYYVDAYFDRHAEHILAGIPYHRFTTTRAVWSRTFTDRTEAHVFIARAPSALEAVIGAGWYPLVVDGEIVDKHPADHEKFGRALGYPQCCQEFFRQRNNWHFDNTYYAAYSNTTKPPKLLSNSLLRHTAFTFAPHIACSFACDATINYAAKLLVIISDEIPLYSSQIKRRLASPVLCLSELQIYSFEGELLSEHNVLYDNVEPQPPSTVNDPLYKLLSDGDQCVIDGNIVRILKKGKQLGAYMARADKHGPEIPFMVQCRQ